MRKKWNAPMWGGGIFSENIESAMKTFLTAEELSDVSLVKKLTKDIVNSYIKYGTTPQEYFLFGFRHEGHERRKKFLCNSYKDKLMLKAVGAKRYALELRDKYAFYQRYSSFFKRDVCRIVDIEDKSEFIRFCSLHPDFIAKPLGGMCGVGCHVVRGVDNPEAMFEELSSKGTWIIEELIIQHESMSAWNDSSVNTVRIPSFLNSQGFHVLKPFFRTGRKGSVVDNAAQGGLFAIVDEKTGVLLTDGTTEFGGCHQNHPDSGLKFKGWQVPQWEQLLKIAEEAHRILPHYPYIGWDFAYTDAGWVLIEGDWGQFVSEFNDREGIKETFEKLVEVK